jgi:hypothetical protein
MSRTRTPDPRRAIRSSAAKQRKDAKDREQAMDKALERVWAAAEKLAHGPAYVRNPLERMEAFAMIMEETVKPDSAFNRETWSKQRWAEERAANIALAKERLARR